MGRLLAGVVSLLLVGCSAGGVPEPSPVPFGWQEAALPSSGDVPVVREAVWCGDGWFVVGAVRDAAGETRPAVWSSVDGRSWSVVPVAPRSYYGERSVLVMGACREGRLAAVGWKRGGAHANPRTASWLRAADGVLRELPAPFELYGGPQAMNVSRLDAGDGGFLISGNRMSGAAVWWSGDASRFELRERVAGLASDSSGETWAFDGLAAGSGWLVVGGCLPAGRIDRDVCGWRSVDGVSWERLIAEGDSSEYEELHRVVLVDGVPLAVGFRGSVFGVWRLEPGRWRPVGSFGSWRASAWSGVHSVVVAGSRLVVSAGDGVGYALWVSSDGGVSWGRVEPPVVVGARPEVALSVTAGGGRLVLVADDGVTGRVYTADIGA
ncbi:hypothetical protein KZ829_09880 [Actinoplanes hulinensis]|uniref:Exo-alpha-sialidase n=1 Tax=Actinoplanes hulinensis TaxID=1144547 RepID=A0ABS7AZ82_9ACTN|nr:hypothetical protein [Actinoplanes hulinensis]MBW6434045.1 hypothetical protein [Actinoplanes hulinensis]